MQSICSKTGGLSLTVLRTTVPADLALSNFISQHTSAQSPRPAIPQTPQETPALEACSVPSLRPEGRNPTYAILLHYFLQTSAQMPCALTVLSWPPDLNISPPHHASSLLACTTLFYVTYYHLRGVTGLFTLCLLCKPQESRDFICSLLFPSVL